MGICLSHISALEALRTLRELTPDLLDGPRHARIDGARLSDPHLRWGDLSRIGVKTLPVHLLVGSQERRYAKRDVACHLHSGTLPPRSLIAATRTIDICSPGLCLLQLAAGKAYDFRPQGPLCSSEAGNGPGGAFRAAHADSAERSDAAVRVDPAEHADSATCSDLARERGVGAEIGLALIAFEMLGTYALHTDGTGFASVDQPLAKLDEMRELLARMGRAPGRTLAERALELALPRSNSPMETAMALVFSGPRRIGGLGLPRGEMNFRVDTPSGPRFVDYAWPEQHVGLEYLGRKEHAGEQKRERDDRRANALAAAGMTLLSVRMADLTDAELFKQLARNVSRALNVSIRIRSASFAHRRRLLLSHALPPVERWGM